MAPAFAGDHAKSKWGYLTGELHFTGSKLKERFPELNSLCGRFERWLRKNELVYDNTKRELFSPFEWSLCTSGILKKVYAFPEALHLFQKGACMCDWSVNDFVYAKFLRALELQGRKCEQAGSANPHAFGTFGTSAAEIVYYLPPNI